MKGVLFRLGGSFAERSSYAADRKFSPHCRPGLTYGAKRNRLALDPIRQPEDPISGEARRTDGYCDRTRLATTWRSSVSPWDRSAGVRSGLQKAAKPSGCPSTSSRLDTRPCRSLLSSQPENWSKPVARIHRYAIALRANLADGIPMRVGGGQRDHPNGDLRADVGCERAMFSRFEGFPLRIGKLRRRTLLECTLRHSWAWVTNPSASTCKPITIPTVV